MSIDRDVIEIARKDAKEHRVSLSREISDVLRKLYVEAGHSISEESIAMTPVERGRRGGIASGVSKRAASGQNGSVESDVSNVGA